MKPAFAIFFLLAVCIFPLNTAVADDPRNGSADSSADLDRLRATLSVINGKSGGCASGNCAKFSCDDTKALHDSLAGVIRDLKILLAAHQEFSRLHLQKLKEIQDEAHLLDTTDRRYALALATAAYDGFKIGADLVALADGVQVLRSAILHGLIYDKGLAGDQLGEQFNELFGLVDDAMRAINDFHGKPELDELRSKQTATMLELKSNATDMWHAYEHFKEAYELAGNPTTKSEALNHQLHEMASNLSLAALRFANIIAEKELEVLREQIAEDEEAAAGLDKNHAEVLGDLTQTIHREGEIQKALANARATYTKAADCWDRCKLSDDDVNATVRTNGGTNGQPWNYLGLSVGDTIKKYAAELGSSVTRVTAAAGRISTTGGAAPQISANPAEVLSGDSVSVKYKVLVCRETEGAAIRWVKTLDAGSEAYNRTQEFGSAKPGDEQTLQVVAPRNQNNPGITDFYRTQIFVREATNYDPNKAHGYSVTPERVLAYAPFSVGNAIPTTKVGRLSPKEFTLQIGSDAQSIFQFLHVTVSPAYSVSPNGSVDVAFTFDVIWNTWWHIFTVTVQDVKGVGAVTADTHAWVGYPEQRVKSVRAIYDTGSSAPVRPGEDALLTAPHGAHRLKEIDVVFQTPQSGDLVVKWDLNVPFP